MFNQMIITRAKGALRRMKSKKGQTLVEYALILAFHFCRRHFRSQCALGGPGSKGVFTTITSQLSGRFGSSH